jgi:uncharacterized protein (DUF302 family)
MTTPASEASLTYGRAVGTALSFAEAVDRARAQLKEEGFGVLCDIDVAATMREKLGESFRPYRILGACNPQLAHRALEAQPYLGLLLPCNLIVQESDGKTLVAAIDAHAMLGVTGDPQLSALADEVNARLGRVLDAIASAS